MSDAGSARMASAKAVTPPESPDNVGTALRSAFQAAVQEDVPQEMLDLLRRLE